MDDTKRRLVAGLAVTAALLVPLAVLGGPALARSAASEYEYDHSSSSEYQYKVHVCHQTHSKKHHWVLINISSSAVHAHLKHGDFLASLTSPCPPANASSLAPTSHGKGHSKDKGHGHGK
jgi:hypothetical protein